MFEAEFREYVEGVGLLLLKGLEVYVVTCRGFVNSLFRIEIEELDNLTKGKLRDILCIEIHNMVQYIIKDSFRVDKEIIIKKLKDAYHSL
jgi:hypothetical protein